MTTDDYATSITAESCAVFERAFFGYLAEGAGFDAAMQTAILEEQEFIEMCREAARQNEEA